MKVLDWYNHQGHQYEFFKLEYDFYLLGIGEVYPDWNEKTRPKHKNVKEVCIDDILNETFDVVMYRTGGRKKWIESFVSKGASAIAVVQTTTPPDIPSYVKHVVWNSVVTMNKYKNYFKHAKHIYIPHGFDHNEFLDQGLDRNGQILSVANVFKPRGDLLGYSDWSKVRNSLGCKLVGHGNEDISPEIKQSETFDELLREYNSNSIYLNTTIESAMPRSRAEAMMCGMALVTTNNYDISRYVSHGKSAFLCKNYKDMIKYCKMLKEDKNLCQDMGMAAREAAIKHFDISTYLSRWRDVFNSL
jgi:glycosyltransferase involved in cell wall biosynthesis